MNSKLLVNLAVLFFGGLMGTVANAAIIYPREPEGGRQMVMRFAAEFVGRNLPPFKRISSTNDLTLAPPLQAFAAGNLAQGKLLIGATSGGNGWQAWKYIFMRGTNIVGDAWLEADEKTGRAIKCTSIGESGFNVEIETTLNEAAQMPEVQLHDYEARLLDDHLVSFFAVWLHGKTNDIIIPLAPTYNRMHAYLPYSERQIIEILEPEAKRDVVMWKKFNEQMGDVVTERNLNEQQQKNNDVYARAMMDYEKAHGGNCGPISYYGMSAPFETLAPHVQTFTLMGKSSKCGDLKYKVKVTYGLFMEDVKKVEILEKLPTAGTKDGP